jgi:hypothetical protein
LPRRPRRAPRQPIGGNDWPDPGQNPWSKTQRQPQPWVPEATKCRKLELVPGNQPRVDPSSAHEPSVYGTATPEREREPKARAFGGPSACRARPARR